MKKYVISSLLFLMPFVAMAADDHCTKPNEYTIDKRCYVTDELKEKYPYYNSVALVKKYPSHWYVEGEADNVCSGVIINGKDGKPYLYTAKHCIAYRSDDKPLGPVVKLQNDTQESYTAPYAVGAGVGDKVDRVVRERDWAVFSFREQYEEKFKAVAVDKSSKKTESNAQLVGYGTLKIMSDKQIRELQEAYATWLEKNQNSGSLGAYRYKDNKGLVDGVLRTLDEIVAEFMSYTSWESDVKLKVSFCKYGPNGGDDCQGWGGNSGGPIFDSDGKVMAIVTMGGGCIGGSCHASIAEEPEFSIKINDINSQPTKKTPVKKGTTAVKKTNKK